MISFLEHNGHGNYELLNVKKNNNDSSKYLYSTENLHHSLEQHESEYLTEFFIILFNLFKCILWGVVFTGQLDINCCLLSTYVKREPLCLNHSFKRIYIYIKEKYFSKLCANMLLYNPPSLKKKKSPFKCTFI